MKTNTLDHRVLTQLLQVPAPTQVELAKTLKVKPDAVAKSLTRLHSLGLVDLQRAGVRTDPKLRLFSLFEQVSFAISHLQSSLAGAYE
jgi:predicted transcriptional regulator